MKIRLILSAVALSLAGSRPMAQTQATGPLDEPSSISFDLKLAAGKNTYAINEIIPIDLVFQGRAGKGWEFSTMPAERWGVPDETYHVTPADSVQDPLWDYYHGMFGHGGSILSSGHALDGTPYVARVFLNDWMRFTVPGRYVITASSRRLVRNFMPTDIQLTAPPIEIVITPEDPSLDASELARGKQLLSSALPADITTGSAILRQLRTPDAAIALVDSYDELVSRSDYQARAGVMSSPFHQAIVNRMQARLDRGEPLPSGYIDTLAFVRLLDEAPPGTDYALRSARHKALVSQDTDRWTAAALRGPTPAALGALLLTRQASDLTRAYIETHHDQVAAAILALGARDRAELFNTGWALISGPWILPTLRAAYDRSAPEPIASEADAALKRILEMDAATGRTLILEEIRTGAYGVGYDVLASLPDVMLPDLDGPLQSRFSNGGRDASTAAWLIARYGTSQLTPFVNARLTMPLACDPQAAFIAFLLKHDPPAGERRLAPGAIVRRGCVDVPLAELARRYWDDRVESAALKALESASIRTAVDAAQVLSGHGAPDDKTALIARLKRWSDEWHDRAAELAKLASSIDSPARLENLVTVALLDSKRWTLTAEEKETIRGLCVTDGCRNNVSARIGARR